MTPSFMTESMNNSRSQSRLRSAEALISSSEVDGAESPVDAHLFGHTVTLVAPTCLRRHTCVASRRCSSIHRPERAAPVPCVFIVTPGQWRRRRHFCQASQEPHPCTEASVYPAEATRAVFACSPAASSRGALQKACTSVIKFEIVAVHNL